MAGYSGTPLAQKLGLKAGQRVLFLQLPEGVLGDSGALPEGLLRRTRLAGELDYIHLFVRERAELERRFPQLLRHLADGGMIWISWPKKTRAKSGAATPKKSDHAPAPAAGLTENDVRAIGLALGVVDVKVCAVDEVWSGLKFLRRKAKPPGRD